MKARRPSSMPGRALGRPARGHLLDRRRKRTDGAEFLARALLTRAVRQAGAHQLLKGGACALVVVVGSVEDAVIVAQAAETMLESTSRGGRHDWTVVDRASKRQAASRNPSGAHPPDEVGEAARTLVVTDGASALPPSFEAMADGVAFVGKPDWTLVKAAFRIVMGQLPAAEMPDGLLASIPLAAYGTAIRPGAGCVRAIARLKRLAAARSTRELADRHGGDGPSIDDLHGLGAAADWGRALARDLADYRSGRIQWKDVDRGILLSSPPGMGKTTFAQALGRTCNVPVHVHSLAAWQARGYLNDLLKAMREAFDKAKASAPCVLFIDEIDSFGDREKLRGHNENYNREVINGLLECLDGADGREGVVVVGATNHPDAIDAGIKRPGRLDRHIVIPLPDVAARIGILRYHLGNDLQATDLSPLARRLDKASGALLAQIVRDGRRRARTAKRPVALVDLEACLPQTVRLSPAAFRRSCVHEAGHVVVGLLLAAESGSELQGATVDAEVSGPEGGCTRFAHDLGFDQTRASCLAEATILLAGLAGERVILGEHGFGGGGEMQSDLARATRLLGEMETSHGLGERLVFTTPAGSTELFDYLRGEAEVGKRVDAQLRACLDRSILLLSADRDALVAVADVLGRQSRISAEEARRLVRPDPSKSPNPAKEA